MDSKASGFDWDGGSLEHCRKHGVPKAEIEELFRRPIVVLPDDTHSQAERRLRAICITKPGRAIFWYSPCANEAAQN